MFGLCSHYDYSLRALKSVLVSAGNVKRDRIQRIKDEKLSRGESMDEGVIAEQLPEQEILIQSVMETMVPKLVAEDIPLLYRWGAIEMEKEKLSKSPLHTSIVYIFR